MAKGVSLSPAGSKPVRKRTLGSGRESGLFHKSVRRSPSEILTTANACILVVENDAPMMMACSGAMRVLNRNVERVLDASRKGLL
jgi:hypothetical protein